MMNEHDLTVFQVEIEDVRPGSAAGVVKTTCKMLGLGVAFVLLWQLLATDWSQERLRKNIRQISSDPLAFAMATGLAETLPGEDGRGETPAKVVFVPARQIPELRGLICQEVSTGEIYIHQYRAGARLHPDDRHRVEGGIEKAFCDTALASYG